MISDYELFERIKVKLDNHDKSLFTALELNLLKETVSMRLAQLFALKNMSDKF